MFYEQRAKTILFFYFVQFYFCLVLSVYKHVSQTLTTHTGVCFSENKTANVSHR